MMKVLAVMTYFQISLPTHNWDSAFFCRRMGFVEGRKAKTRHKAGFSERWWREKDSNLRRQSRQIYSLIPLAAREPLPKCEAAYYQIRQGCEPLGRILTTKKCQVVIF